MKKAVSLALAFLLLLPCLSLAGCGRQEQGGQDDARVITDMAGRTVELPLEVERIACQSSTCEAVIISLGKATKLVGTTDYTDESSFAFQLFPELSQVTKLADDMSVEEMLEKDVQVVFVKDTNKLDTVAGTKEGVKLIGQVIGAEDRAAKCVEYIDRCETTVTERMQGSEAFTAYYARAKYAESNLLTTYAAGHIYSEWIGFSGGSVITKDMELAETKGGVLISGEELLRSDPDVIFIGGYYRNPVFRDAMTGEYSTVLRAVTQGRVFMVPTSVTDWSVGGCELGLTILWCAQQVAPDRFSDIDMAEELIAFYRDVAGITVSEELAADILSSNSK